MGYSHLPLVLGHWDIQYAHSESAQAAIRLILDSGLCVARLRSNQGEASKPGLDGQDGRDGRDERDEQDLPSPSGSSY